jgi:hypothetical protein
LSAEDEQRHIPFKELKAVRHVVESFLPPLTGRNVLLHAATRKFLTFSQA